jgi:hypothetical protein
VSETPVPAGTRRVAAVFRGAPGTPLPEVRNYSRLLVIFDAITAAGVAVEPVLFDEASAEVSLERLFTVDGVLVWVDPLQGDRDRSVLDAFLREVAARGVWVSAHPDTILKMGTKEVLYRTRSLGWGGDVRMYSTLAEFRDRFPESIASGAPRVVKQNRGNGGIGVWKVTLTDADRGIVRVQHAAPRDDVTEDVTLDDFTQRCASYFEGSGKLVDQPFGERLLEGIIRAYFVEREVVGFARQQPTRSDAPDRVLGMPSAKTMYSASEPQFVELRSRLEEEWLPGLQRLVDLRDDEVPMLWDADFLYGPITDRGDDTYMLCEINVSCVIPFPDDVPRKLAAAVRRRAPTTT